MDGSTTQGHSEAGMAEDAQVSILDDAVSPENLSAMQRLLYGPIWAYGWKSSKDNNRFSFWHAHFAGGDEESTADCSGELASNESAGPVFLLWKELSAGLLRDQILVRAYANAHTYGVDGYVHQDSKSEDHFTTVVYAHRQWKHHWAGETVFFSRQKNDVARAVSPKPGRAVHFCGAIPHVARAPSRDCPELRITVVFKTRKA